MKREGEQGGGSRLEGALEGIRGEMGGRDLLGPVYRREYSSSGRERYE